MEVFNVIKHGEVVKSFAYEFEAESFAREIEGCVSKSEIENYYPVIVASKEDITDRFDTSNLTESEIEQALKRILSVCKFNDSFYENYWLAVDYEMENYDCKKLE